MVFMAWLTLDLYAVSTGYIELLLTAKIEHCSIWQLLTPSLVLIPDSIQDSKEAATTATANLKIILKQQFISDDGNGTAHCSGCGAILSIANWYREEYKGKQLAMKKQKLIYGGQK